MFVFGDCGELVDLIMVMLEFVNIDLLEEVGGVLYLIDIVNFVLIVVNIEYYVKIVEEKLIFCCLIRMVIMIV